MVPSTLPIDGSRFTLDTSGVTGVIGRDESVSAMAAVHAYGNRRWLGWYDSPISYAIAKRYGFARSRFFDRFYADVHTDPATLFELDGWKGPKFRAAYSGSIIEETGHLATLFMECKDRERKVVRGERTRAAGLESRSSSSARFSQVRRGPNIPTHISPRLSPVSGHDVSHDLSEESDSEPSSPGFDVPIYPLDHSGKSTSSSMEKLSDTPAMLGDGRSPHADSPPILPNDITGLVTREEDPSGAGNFADIYKGILWKHGRPIPVAVKVVKIYAAKDEPKKQRQIRREIAIWLRLNHPNVLPLYGTTMGFSKFPAMVCPWVENGTLTSYLEEQSANLAMDDRWILVNDVAAGLQYLHSQSVVHGDLSGSNVLVDATGRACIADFGLATLLSGLGLGSMFITSSQGKGTARWMAPELLDIQGEDDDQHNIATTQQSDIFSFGSIMLQTLSGKVPYYYYPRDMQVIHALSRGRMPKRPEGDVITDSQWEFIGQCWSLVIESRPSADEIVEFTKNELVSSLA